METQKIISITEAKDQYSINVVKLSKILSYMNAKEKELEDVELAKKEGDKEYEEMSQQTADYFDKQANFLLQQVTEKDIQLMCTYEFVFLHGEGGKNLIQVTEI